MNPFLIGGIIDTVGKVADDLFTSDEERARAQLDAYVAESDRMRGQVEINTAEAQHQSLFVAGWRPAIGWCGALAMGYQFLLYPLMVWGWSAMSAAGWIPAGLTPPPQLETESLWVIMTGMLGIGTLRSVEKIKLPK
jgi:hypothetical protein